MSAPPDAGRRQRSSPAMGGVARGSSANLLGAVVMAACTFALTIVVTRGLSQQAAGIFFSATSLFVLATTVGQLGTNTGLVYFISRVRALGRPSAVADYYRTAMRPVLVTAVVMAVAMYVFARPLATVVTPGHVEETASYLRVLAFFVPLAGSTNVTLAATRGLGTMRPNVIVEQLVRPVLQLLLVVLAVIILPSSGALAWAWASPYLPAAILAALWWRRLSRRVIRRSEESPSAGGDDEPNSIAGQGPAGQKNLRHSREFWRFTAPRALASVGQMAMQRLDIIIVAAIAGPAEAAVYTAATRFLVVGQMGNRAISLAVQPRLGAALAQSRIADANHYYRTSTAWLIAVAWPLYLVFIVFGSLLLTIFGTDYDTGVSVLLLLSLSMLLATGCGMVDMVLNMAGRTSWNLYNVLLSVGVQLTLCLVLIPRMGILGAAIAWAAAIALSNLVPLAQIGLTMGLHPFGRAPLIAASLSLVCFAGVGLAGRLVLGTTLTGLVVSLAVGVSLYLPALWVFRQPLELGALRDLRAGKRRRAAAGQGESSDG